MTVKELIRQLRQVDESTPVEIIEYKICKVNGLPERVGLIVSDIKVEAKKDSLSLVIGAEDLK